MFLFRKNELSKYTHAKINPSYKGFNYDFDLLFYGNIWNDYNFSEIISKLNSNSEEYLILRKMYQLECDEIDTDSRSYLYLMSSLRQLSHYNKDNNLDLLAIYIMYNTIKLKEVESAMEKMWSLAIFDQISNSFNSTSFNFISSYIKDRFKKNSYKNNSIDYFSYCNEKNIHLPLMEKYFIYNHKYMFDSILVNQIFQPDTKKDIYCMDDSLDIYKSRIMVKYIPNDVFCYYIDRLVKLKLGIPILNNMIYYKNIYSFIHQLKNKYDSEFLNKIKQIYQAIETGSSILHKCENKEVKNIYKDICHGKI